jgi:hypothetical protein
MGRALEKPQDSLYERDFYAWLEDQAAKLRARSHNDIDWENLAEEVESVGRSQKRELRSRLERLVQHLLKWQFQPGRRSESWRSTISEQRTFIAGLLKDSPSLKRFPAEIFLDAYKNGRLEAIDETGMLASAFPNEPPFNLEQALDRRFLPGEPFQDWLVIRD